MIIIKWQIQVHVEHVHITLSYQLCEYTITNFMYTYMHTVTIIYPSARLLYMNSITAPISWRQVEDGKKMKSCWRECAVSRQY